MKSKAESPLAWGFGSARLVEPAGGDTEVVAFMSDQHFPYQDPAVIVSALKLTKRIKPDRIVLNGDLVDAHQLSRFFDGTARFDQVQNDLDETNEFLRALRKANPNAVIDFTVGNHDDRITSNVPATLATLDGVQLDGLLDLSYNDINLHQGCGFLLRENFLVYHGTKLSSIPGGTARAELLANRVSGTSGHVHRAEKSSRHGYSPGEWTVTGCMCSLEPEYIVGVPEWDQGIAIGEFLRSGSFVMHQVPFVDGALRFGKS